MYTVYILYSESSKKKYVGYTTNLIERYKSHNFLSTKGFTLRYRPWLVLYTEIFETVEEALKREKQLKGGKGRDWIDTEIIPKYRALGFISA